MHPRKIRTDQEQVSFLRARLEREKAKAIVEPHEPYSLNTRKRGVDCIVPAHIPEADMIRFLRKLGWKVFKE